MARAETPAATAGQALGLDVNSDVAVPGLLPAQRPTGRVLRIELAGPGEIVADWPEAGTETLVERTDAAGAVAYRIARHPRAGWWFDTPGEGTFVLDAAGARVR